MSSGLIGRVGPFRRRTLASVFRPTTRKSPWPAACGEADVAGVQQVEAAVGEGDRLPREAAATDLGDQALAIEPLARLGAVVVEQVAEDLLRESSATPIFSTSRPPATLASAAASS